MGSQSECHSWEEFLQMAKNPVVYNKTFMCIYCFLLDYIFFRSKAIHFYSKKFISSGSSVFKIIFGLFRFYKKCVIWPKKPENFALSRYYHSTKFVLGTFLSPFSRTRCYQSSFKWFLCNSVDTYRRDSVCMMMPTALEHKNLVHLDPSLCPSKTWQYQTNVTWALAKKSFGKC